MGDVKGQTEADATYSNSGLPGGDDVETDERASSNEDEGTTDVAASEADASEEAGGDSAPAGQDVAAELAAFKADATERERKYQSDVDRLTAENTRLSDSLRPHQDAAARERRDQANSLEAFQERAAEIGEVAAIREIATSEARQIVTDALAARDTTRQRENYVRDAVTKLESAFTDAGKTKADFTAWYAERSWNSLDAAMADAKLHLGAETAKQALKTAEENALRAGEKRAREVKGEQTPRGGSGPSIGGGSMPASDMERLEKASETIGRGRSVL